MMAYPRVFRGSEEVTSAAAATSNSADDALVPAPEFVDVLLVCGQGVYDSGTYYGEFHDRDVYFDHAVRFPEVSRRLGFTAVVLSGGFTQARAPSESEAESFLRILKDAQIDAPNVPIILDECALDSAENLLLGLMTARLVLGSAPIRRIGIWAAWRFKKWRFNRNAQALGIVEQTYFYGFADASATNIQVPEEDQRQKTFEQYKADLVEYNLLRAADKEAKRRQRWQNNRIDDDRVPSITTLEGRHDSRWTRKLKDGMPESYADDKLCSRYGNRLEAFSQFGATLTCLKRIGLGSSPDEVGLSAAFRKEVIDPRLGS
jgi:hypothetical protein